MADAGDGGRLSLSEDKMLRLLAEFRVELLQDLDKRFKDVATSVALAALETRTNHALDNVRLVVDDHGRRLQKVEQTDAAGTALGVFFRWAIPICLGLLIALSPYLRNG